MAKKKSGWDSLSASQQANFKATNFNKSIKVSESTIQGLRDGKTFEGNVAKFKTGSTAEQREAMNRFYGKTRVDTALGSSVSSVNKTYPGSPGPSFKGVGSTNYISPKKAPDLGSGRFNWASGTGGNGKKGGITAASRNFNNAVEAGIVAAIPLGKAVKMFQAARAARGAVKVTPKPAIALPGRPAPKQITSGPKSKAITGSPKPKEITGSRKPLQITAGPSLDTKFATAVTRSKAANTAFKRAVDAQRKGLMTSGEVRAVQKTAELERMNVGIVANAIRVSRGTKKKPVRVGPIFQKPTTPRVPNSKKPVNTGKTKDSAFPPKQPPAPKAPKSAKKVATPKERYKAISAEAKAQRAGIAKAEAKMTAPKKFTRVPDASTQSRLEKTRAELIERGSTNGTRTPEQAKRFKDALESRDRRKYADKLADMKAWEKELVLMKESSEVVKAANKVKKVAPKKVTKKTTTKGKK